MNSPEGLTDTSWDGAQPSKCLSQWNRVTLCRGFPEPTHGRRLVLCVALRRFLLLAQENRHSLRLGLHGWTGLAPAM